VLVDGIVARTEGLGGGEIDERGAVVLNPTHFTETDDGKEHTDTGARCNLQVLGDGVDHLGSPADLGQRDDDEDDTFNQHSGEGDFPRNAHAEHDGEGEVGVEPHPRCQGEGEVSPQAHDHTANKGSDGSGEEGVVVRNACCTEVVQHRRVHNQDVRHRQEGRQSGSQFTV